MPNRRHNSRRFTPSCSNSITNSCRCDMIDFSDHGIPAPPQQAKDADRMCPPCLRKPVHYLSGLYRGGEGGVRWGITERWPSPTSPSRRVSDGSPPSPPASGRRGQRRMVMAQTRPTLAALAADLAAGRITSRELVDAALVRIADPAGEGGRAFVKVYDEAARAAADAQDRLRAAGYVASPLAGIPGSIKDLFDVAGEVTLAGSRALDDAPVLARL